MLYLKFLFIFSRLTVEDSRLVGEAILGALLMVVIAAVLVSVKHRKD